MSFIAMLFVFALFACFSSLAIAGQDDNGTPLTRIEVVFDCGMIENQDAMFHGRDMNSGTNFNIYHKNEKNSLTAGQRHFYTKGRESPGINKILSV